MLSRVRVLLLVAAAPLALGAQVAPRTVVEDLLERMTSDLNDLRYGDAIATGRMLTAQAATLPPATRSRLHLLLAAAFFPEETAIQQPDSAFTHLTTAITLTPDASYPADLRWRGLDSLVAAVRSTTLSAALRLPERQRVAGPGGEASAVVVASARSTMTLRVRDERGELAWSDSSTIERGRFLIPVHDGSRMILRPGRYRLELLVRRLGGTDSVVIVREATLEAQLPVLVAEPPLDPALLLPEVATPDRRQALRLGAGTALGTIVIATVFRSDPDLRSSFSVDPRAYAVGGAVAISVAAFAWKAKARPIPVNAARNALTRASHERGIGEIRSQNAARLAGYEGILVAMPEVP